MRNVTRFIWNFAIIEHMAGHGVTPSEIEEVAFENEVLIRSGKSDLHYLLGTAKSGRYLFIVVKTTGRAGEVKTITARDMTAKERKYYKKRGK